ncbi:hypothetical protein ACOACO_02600 [Nocardioides sp. CPCC 205120]|uniref:hypothetical protein n=1 Tax=Nocardioides sp. CPCC 205120 TaxID=3406462 RepID=UPI003B50653D
MTDPTDRPAPGDDAPLDPATEARVRGLLRAAAERSPMPADVAARLDDVLAGLAAERAGAAPAATPAQNALPPRPDASPAHRPAPELVDLAAARRRRRVARGLLVAAAAVVVVGVGGTVVPRLGGSESDSESSEVAGEAPQGSSAEEQEDAGPASPGYDAPGAAPEADVQDRAVTAAAALTPYAGQVLAGPDGVVLSAGPDLDAQVADLLSSVAAAPAPAAGDCGEPGPGAVGVLTTYAGTPARVDVTLPEGDAGTVDVVVRACGTGDRLDALRLARP